MMFFATTVDAVSCNNKVINTSYSNMTAATTIKVTTSSEGVDEDDHVATHHCEGTRDAIGNLWSRLRSPGAPTL